MTESMQRVITKLSQLLSSCPGFLLDFSVEHLAKMNPYKRLVFLGNGECPLTPEMQTRVSQVSVVGLMVEEFRSIAP